MFFVLNKQCQLMQIHIPRCSKYGIFTTFDCFFVVHVGQYFLEMAFLFCTYFVQTYIRAVYTPESLSFWERHSWTTIGIPLPLHATLLQRSLRYPYCSEPNNANLWVILADLFIWLGKKHPKNLPIPPDPIRIQGLTPIPRSQDCKVIPLLGHTWILMDDIYCITKLLIQKIRQHLGITSYREVVDAPIWLEPPGK